MLDGNRYRVPWQFHNLSNYNLEGRCAASSLAMMWKEGDCIIGDSVDDTGCHSETCYANIGERVGVARSCKTAFRWLETTLFPLLFECNNPHWTVGFY